ncbi:MAG: hypothetical protein A4E32_01202 [Methanomassiliicoccales archaeon PtaU1.Bin124]|nr:MAG: hypothetical protein A4E32_01202 [Methanomassiliicoccales archaeon PtaU1.Bin124]
MQCPHCGHEDTFNLGFCTACGATFKREAQQTRGFDNTGFPLERPPTYQELKRYTIGGLLFATIMGFVILFYLLLNETDPVLIVFVELFPIVWFILILVQWVENKGKVKKA